MIQNLKEWGSLFSNVITALAFMVAVFQLRNVRRQNRIESHLNFGQAERAIWIAALGQKDIAPNILAATWNNTPNVSPSEELFLAILLDHYEHQFIRQKNRIISPEVWRRVDDYITYQLSTQPAHAIWNAIKKHYSPDFVAHFDGKLAG